MARLFAAGSLLCAVVFAGPLAAQVTAHAPPAPRFTIERFEVVGPNPLTAEQTERALAPFIGEHEGLAGLRAAADALHAEIGARGHSFHSVILPPQRLTAGTVTLEVVTVAVGTVTVIGNEFFSEQNVRASLPTLREGATPDTRELARALRLANEHPVKSLGVTFKESETANAVDATVRVEDSRPWQYFASLNNTGSDETGDLRLSAAFQHTNLFERDHSLIASYTTSPSKPEDVSQWAAVYSLPLYEYHSSLSMYFVDSDVTITNLPGFAGLFGANGQGRFYGARYAYHLPSQGNWSHKLGVGLDNKLFESSLNALGQQVAGSDVRSTPISASYTGLYEGEQLTANVHVEYATNTEFGSQNKQSFYTAADPRGIADVSWSAWRFSGSLTRAFAEGMFAGWTGYLAMQAQWANEALITGEQFGIGGAASVRGFDERELTGDDGWRMSAELYTPPIYFGARLLAFLDSGWVKSRAAPGFARTSEQITSVGVGARWQWREYLSAQIDLANVIDGSPTRDPGTKKIHFNLFVRY
jgi:hemolysin activation/secretion protein